MNTRRAIACLMATLFLVAGPGCKKSEPSTTAMPPAPTVLSPDTVAHVHWLGRKHLEGEASAYYFMRIWRLPQSAMLEIQTLDKLSTAPWRLLLGDAAASAAPAFLLRPLLDDVVQGECYFEVRTATNRPAEMVFVIKLDEQRAGLWRTNLAGAVGSLTGIATMQLRDGGTSWSFDGQNPPRIIELVRVGDWTIVGVAKEKSVLLGEIVARIAHDRVPFSKGGAKYWLDAGFDLSRAPKDFGFESSSANLPAITLTVGGDGGNVVTRGELTFPEPLRIQFEPWTVPTSLIHEPLAGFAAVRGLSSWLASCKAWNDLQIGAPPDQLFCWTASGSPVQFYLAGSLLDASNRVHALTDGLLQRGNPWLASYGEGKFESLQDVNGAVWRGLNLISPFVQSVGSGRESLFFGGLVTNADAQIDRPLSAGLTRKLFGQTNLIYYEWEASGPRIESFLYAGQVLRMAFRRLQLPVESASAAWLNAFMFRSGDSETELTSEGENHLSFIRKSTVGFNALELHLLADWLESPRFPCGFSTFSTPGKSVAMKTGQ